MKTGFIERRSQLVLYYLNIRICELESYEHTEKILGEQISFYLDNDRNIVVKVVFESDIAINAEVVEVIVSN